MAEPKGIQVVARNRKARHDYEILERIEAGLVLMGSEIKSIRDGKVSLREGHVQVEAGEAWLVGVNIAPYPQATHVNHEPLRRRKLLLHHREIEKLRIRVEEKGLTIVPLALYLKRGRAKVEIAVARGRKHEDRRETERRRQAERDAEREARRSGGRR